MKISQSWDNLQTNYFKNPPQKKKKRKNKQKHKKKHRNEAWPPKLVSHLSHPTSNGQTRASSPNAMLGWSTRES
jgi:hypothetical protein